VKEGSQTDSSSTCKLFKQAQSWLQEDWRRVEKSFAGREDAFRGKRILVTGAAGFLGFNFLNFFSFLNSKGSIPVTVVAADNYVRGHPRWLLELANADPHVISKRCDITFPWQDTDYQFDFIIHGASIASPPVYRKFPLETLDANIVGLRHMLDLARQHGSESLLYFSTSEIYGDPPPNEIPTKETYKGNVACLGPRACYDESKRVGETLSAIYAQQYQVPVKIIRPFNNYGPGLRLADGRVLPDFSRDALNDRDIVLYSDGSPTRTFCYSSDALTGYLLALLSPHNGEPFNIGTEEPEISMRDIATLLLRVAGSNRKVVQQVSKEADYLTDNPNRRCPDLSKARSLLGYSPKVSLEEGLGRMLDWYKNYVELEELIED
jgi:dTDP-glucose 4,6-dehydratase/UDP-glucuronate decarboxylase